MKILHTADWHLGKRLDNFSRLEEQKLVMDEIVQNADEQNVDLVLIAGDLFDTFNPSVEAVELFYKTLKRLAKNGERPVIAIGGNHDSPDRIDAPDPLARECGIILIGHPKAIVNPFQLDGFTVTNSDEGFIEIQLKNNPTPIRILHTAYANEIRLKQYFGEEKDQQLNVVLKEQWETLADKYCDNKGINLLMAHLYMNQQGAELLEEPDGEKPLKIGNADLVYSNCIPSQIQYTALGHLHGYNNVGSVEKPVVYSSSPLCYSFSEAGQTKYVSIIEAEANQPVILSKIALENGRQLKRVKFSDVNEAVDWLNENLNTLVELTIETDTFLKADERKLIYKSHDGIIHLIPKVKSIKPEEAEYKEINLNQDMKDLFKDYFKAKHANQEPNDEIMDLFNEIMNG